MTQTEFPFLTRCHFCGQVIASASPAILHDPWPVCARDEFEALMSDPDFAWDRDEAPPLTDEEWYGA